jgi:hypothetical protein
MVLEFKEIQKFILPCQTFNLVTKVSQYFAKFHNFLQHKISQNKSNNLVNTKINISFESKILSTTNQMSQ